MVVGHPRPQHLHVHEIRTAYFSSCIFVNIANLYLLIYFQTFIKLKEDLTSFNNCEGLKAVLILFGFLNGCRRNPGSSGPKESQNKI